MKVLNKEENLVVRLNKATKKALKDAALARGMRVSEFVRLIIQDCLKKPDKK